MNQNGNAASGCVFGLIASFGIWIMLGVWVWRLVH
jgi:hypothetical protein